MRLLHFFAMRRAKGEAKMSDTDDVLLVIWYINTALG